MAFKSLEGHYYKKGFLGLEFLTLLLFVYVSLSAEGEMHPLPTMSGTKNSERGQDPDSPDLQRPKRKASLICLPSWLVVSALKVFRVLLIGSIAADFGLRAHQSTTTQGF